MATPRPFVLTALTSDPALAGACAQAGVDRVGVDIERMGKTSRQGHLARARISDHQLSDLPALRVAAPQTTLFARLNPYHQATQAEVEMALAAGARVLMLPYFKTAAEVAGFIAAVNGRGRTAALFETAQAMAQAEAILALPGLDEAMVGLNDLGLSLGLSGPFAVFTTDILERFAKAAHASGVPFGIGGLARVNDESLPAPSDLVIAQHPRLGSSTAWLARSFFRSTADFAILNADVAALRARLAYWAQAPQTEKDAAHAALCAHIRSAERPTQ
jgi:2-keto-3-deoxy-L-rhamnonate aldolase RhmA